MRYRYILLSMIFILFYSLSAFAYNEQDIDLYNHFIICISNVTQEHITEDIRLGLKEVAEAVEDPYILKLCIGH